MILKLYFKGSGSLSDVYLLTISTIEFEDDATLLSSAWGIIRMCKLLYEGVERYIVGVHSLVAEGTMVFLRVILYIEEMDTRGA